jgi:hypothetical protein
VKQSSGKISTANYLTMQQVVSQETLDAAQLPTGEQWKDCVRTMMVPPDRRNKIDLVQVRSVVMALFKASFAGIPESILDNICREASIPFLFDGVYTHYLPLMRPQAVAVPMRYGELVWDDRDVLSDHIWGVLTGEVSLVF